MGKLIREHIIRLDAVCLTHPHCDHLDGLDDLQGLTVFSREELPFYSSPANLAIVHQRFGYVDLLKYTTDDALRWSVPQLDYHEVTDPFQVNGITVTPLPLFHGKAATYGYRVGSRKVQSVVSRLEAQIQGFSPCGLDFII